MIKVSEDVVAALTEDIQTRIKELTTLEQDGVVIYSGEQILTIQQRVTPPAILFHYGGMQKQEKSHSVVFFVYLIAKSQNESQLQEGMVLGDSTLILQELRKALWCDKSRTGHKWDLDSEIPDTVTGDKLLYRQRWSTRYHISN